MEATEEKRLQEVDAPTLKAWMERGEAVLIDVREPSEYAEERIPGARLVPLSTFAPTQVTVQGGQKLVLHCVMGARSAQAGQKLLAAGFVEVCNLRGGIQSWKEAGYAIESSQYGVRRAGSEPPPMSLQPQTRIVAGAVVLIGSILGAVVSAWFLLLSGLVGADLLCAGLTHTDGITMLLTRRLYNRQV